MEKRKNKPDNSQLLNLVFKDVVRYTRVMGGLRLRSYQEQVARAVIRSVMGQQGLSIVVMFPRQSGKNELQAQIEAYLLSMLSTSGAEMVKLSPTYQPQCLVAMRRLESTLQANLLMRNHWEKKAGNLYRFKQANLTFLSASPGANIVGATASTLLQIDEAQDVEIDKYDKEIAPMAASTNATRVFWGTAWTSQTLLAREIRLAQADQDRDGIQRVFRLTADAVCVEVPAYGTFVAGQVARMGRQHPMIRTQYYSEEIDAEGGLFTPERLALLKGSHPALEAPQIGKTYAMLLDLAGEDESARDAQATGLANPGRDATGLTIVEVDLNLLNDPLIRKPLYRVVKRTLWVGEKYATLYARIKALAEHWQVRKLVVDATGVGAGLASFLVDSLGERVIPVVFSSTVKSRLGWGFLAVIDSGRFKDYSVNDVMSYRAYAQHGDVVQAFQENERKGEACLAPTQLQRLFFKQLEATQYTVQPGPEKRLSWGVPDGSRDPASGDLMHDDLVLSAALVSILDELPWFTPAPAVLLPAEDPLIDMDKGY